MVLSFTLASKPRPFQVYLLPFGSLSPTADSQWSHNETGGSPCVLCVGFPCLCRSLPACCCSSISESVVFIFPSQPSLLMAFGLSGLRDTLSY